MRILFLALLLTMGSLVSAYGIDRDYTDTDYMYGQNPSNAQFWQLWLDHKTQLESELSFLANDDGCTISSGTMSCTGGFKSTSGDGTHYGDVTNTIAITAPFTEGNYSYLTDRFWIADGSDWVSRYIFDSDMTIPEANIDADIARDSEVETKYISGTENDYIGTLLGINDIYDVDSTNHAVTIDNKVPAAFTITEISISCDADPTTEQTLTFYHKAAGVGYGTPTTIEAVTTTAGVATVTAGFDDATIPVDVKVFMVLSDPDAALLECAWKIEGDFD